MSQGIDEIRLVEYDSAWPERYRAEVGRIVAALPDGVVRRAEHIGSTAVPGMIAKPIVDLLIGVSDLEEARVTFPPLLERLGYAFWEANPKKDRLFFVKGLPPNGPRTFHIHVTSLDGEMWDRVLFRDYLRIHADEARRYEQLKRELAAMFPEDREAYSEAKTSYHEGVIAKAKGDPLLNGGMTGAEVVALYSELERMGIRVWIDGGWCVDALLGEQTRPHSDLDIALEQTHVQRAREWLEARGYREVKRDSEWNFEMADAAARKVDFHAFVLGDAGEVAAGIQYPNGSLTGVGVINGYSVRCMSPEWMMTFHSGYPPRERDVRDVQALHKKFRIPLPPEYEATA
jgi:GrpB-like predicted nucleotidyltransferase (UPF0157 family)